MRVLHVPYSFFPDPAGGTEVYVRSLATSQRAMGLEAAIAAPAAATSQYEMDGLDVYRFGISPKLRLPELYGRGDPPAARAFGLILDEYRPDIVHLHAFTSVINAMLADEAKLRKLAVVFNYHTPTVSCSRTSLRLFGQEFCDGRVEVTRCTACKLHSVGVPAVLAKGLAHMPPLLSDALRGMAVEGGVWTALRMRELIDVRLKAFHRLMQVSDKVICLCTWTKALLLANSIPQDKLATCRQGIEWDQARFPAPGARPPAGPMLQAAFLGRMDETKGPHLLVEALRAAPQLPLQLDLYGVRQGNTGDRYANRLREMIGTDSRIQLLPAIASSEVIPRLGNCDVVLIPSQWLETGPLVVLEAFAAGTPVIGSNLGGIAELVTDGVNGLLVSEFDSSAAWGHALRRICERPALVDTLRTGIRPPRHSRDAAVELMPVYQEVLGARSLSAGAVTAQ